MWNQPRKKGGATRICSSRFNKSTQTSLNVEEARKRLNIEPLRKIFDFEERIEIDTRASLYIYVGGFIASRVCITHGKNSIGFGVRGLFFVGYHII